MKRTYVSTMLIFRRVFFFVLKSFVVTLRSDHPEEIRARKLLD